MIKGTRAYRTLPNLVLRNGTYFKVCTPLKYGKFILNNKPGGKRRKPFALHMKGCTEHTREARQIMSVHNTFHGGYAVSQLVEALLYEPKGRGFDSR
jgi:hypothetical protein